MPDLRHLHQRLGRDPIRLRQTPVGRRAVRVEPLRPPPLQRPPESGQGAALLLVADPMDEQNAQVVALRGLILDLWIAMHAHHRRRLVRSLRTACAAAPLETVPGVTGQR
jgi:hypothetical protein